MSLHDEAVAVDPQHGGQKGRERGSDSWEVAATHSPPAIGLGSAISIRGGSRAKAAAK